MDMTQQDLSAASGISQSTIAKIEKGRMSASYDTVVKLFESLEDRVQGRSGETTAAEVSSKKVITVQSSEGVHTATEIMRSTGYSQLPVLDGDTPVGSVSDRMIFDLIREGKTMESLKKMTVGDIMGESFPIVSENTPLSAVTAMMSSRNAVLVGKRGKVVGMITNADILKLI